MKNMTALVSAFARACHYRDNTEWVFADRFAEKILTEEEFTAIAENMADGIDYFAPGFEGSREEALRYIVEHQLAPPVLARSALCEQEAERSVEAGCRQIVQFACGYDSFSLLANNRELTVFELDRPEMIADRQRRMADRGLKPVCRVECIGCDLSEPIWKEELIKRGFNSGRTAFGSLLGISYYLSNAEFGYLLKYIASLFCEESCICFDYPLAEDGSDNPLSTGGESRRTREPASSGGESRRTRELASAAGEQMKARYTYHEMRTLLEETGFSICDHMNAGGATERFFKEYNTKNPDHKMTAPEGVGCCLAVRR